MFLVNTDVPVSHVTIRVQGVKKAFQSDENGTFRLALPLGASTYKMTFSKIGYDTFQKNVSVDTDEQLLIELKVTENLLEEVEVSTGYQLIPKERATGSFEIVNRTLYERQISTDVISRLDGIMPSMLFDKRDGYDKNMIVRGSSSLGLTDSKPLIIVDNFPFEGEISSINPNDVENITLLKDAAAASIWGARAGNGVLVITTKRGAYAKKWQLSTVMNTTITEKPDLFYFPRMSSADFIDTEIFLFEKGVFNTALNSVTSRPPVTPVVELLNRNQKGEVPDDELRSALDYYRKVDVRDDLSRFFYRTGINQQYAVELTGGGENYNSDSSVGYDDNKNAPVGSRFSRINLNHQNRIRPMANLEINIGVKYGVIRQDNNQLSTIQMLVGRDVYPYAQLVGENGEPLIIERDYRAAYIDDLEATGNFLDWRYRPYEELSLADNSVLTSNILLNGGVEYTLFPSLTGEIRYQYEQQNTNNRQFYNEDTYYTRNLINRFTQINGGTITRPIPVGGILDQGYAFLKTHSARGQLNFTQNWARNRISAIAGMEIRTSENDGNNRRVYGYDRDVLTSTVVNYVDRFPIYDNLGFISTIPYVNSDYGREYRFISFYVNGAYTFDDKYTFSLSARRDASNLFGVEMNDKWKPLWSVGGAWNIDKERFYNSRLIPKLKLRATYGHSGNVSNNIPAVTTLEYRGMSSLGRYPYAIVSNPPNPQLRWENVSTFNAGVDFGLLGNWITGSVEYYRKTSTDLLSIVNADPTTGFNFFTRNSAELRNTGWDINVNTRVNWGKVHWQGNVMLSINKNRVVQYLWETANPSQWVGIGAAISPIIGQSAYPIVSYGFVGLDETTGDPIGYVEGIPSQDYEAINLRGKIEDLVFHGSALPEYYGGFRNTVSWHGFSLSANITYRAGYFFRRNTLDYSTLLSANGIVGHGDFTKRWQAPGDEKKTTVPSMVYPANYQRDEFYKNSEATVEKGDHVRLQDLNFSYIITDRKELPFRQVKLTLYARNLGIIWKSNKYNLDPDVRGIPMAKSFALGLNVNF